MTRTHEYLIRLVDGQTDLSKAPTEVRLLPFGEVRTKKGTFTNDEQAMHDMIAAFQAHGIDMVFDYEHQTLSGEQAPAAGWITQLVNKGRDGLWAIVNWTERAKQYLANREYRYFSPVFRARKDDGRIVELHSAGLTNKPAMLDIQPLVAKDDDSPSPEGEDAMIKKLIELLKLKADATEDQVIAAVKELQVLKANGVDPIARLAENKAVLEALALKDGATQSEIVGTIHALKQKADTAVKPEEIQALKDKLAKRDADELVAAAMKAGKITPAQKDWADQYALKDPAGFAVFVDKAAAVVPLKSAPAGSRDAGSDEEQGERLVALSMEKDKLSYKDALKKVSKEHPELFPV